eukprot:CAMPEP_0172367686 /NCGR_PEP_ID=MMETSP1060-20121228/23053_1 /TAXON_ID=37318 /ORGANISM="Pseudo-nitzschia pungens, Strain cf. cingulata" /LENGTH=189 /DNA_ID=CAMNT_0013092019 /DNA_START=181 /DNA_END=747 /DNA_ORIENTATION=-
MSSKDGIDSSDNTAASDRTNDLNPMPSVATPGEELGTNIMTAGSAYCDVERSATHLQQDPSTPSSSSEIHDLSFSILWSPLHPITAIFPFIGHMGIADSRGHAHDFQGPYYVGTDGSRPLPRMAFGRPTRYLKMDVVGELPGGPERWDEAILQADGIYRHRMHNLFCDNCHSHVARALNIMEYKGRHDW